MIVDQIDFEMVLGVVPIERTHWRPYQPYYWWKVSGKHALLRLDLYKAAEVSNNATKILRDKR